MRGAYAALLRSNSTSSNSTSKFTSPKVLADYVCSVDLRYPVEVMEPARRSTKEQKSSQKVESPKAENLLDFMVYEAEKEQAL